MIIKALVSKKEGTWGVLQDQEIRYSAMPDPMAITVTMEDLRKYIKLECLSVLAEYELKSFELKPINN
jgi:hypothetical protein